jgi:DNA-binding transcriptional LysR family regulator
MKLSLDEMATFVEVVDSGSFSSASEVSGIPISTISRRISDLEKRLDVQLLHRTTRKQNLTDIGAVYYEHCNRMLNEAKAAELAVQQLQAEPSGVLRTSTPFPLDDPFGSAMFMSFIKKHKKVNIEFFVHTRKVDLIEEKIDCAIIPGTLEDSSLITRGIGSSRIIHCASPAYIQEFGMPESLELLQNHHFVRYETPGWLNLPVSPLTTRVPSRFYTNDFFAARRAALDGVGIAQLPAVQVSNSLENGDLVQVLPALEFSVPVNLVFPSNKKFSTKLRAFIDHIVAYTSAHAPWEV